MTTGSPGVESPPEAATRYTTGLLAELEKLASYIRKVRSDLAAIGPGTIQRTHIPRATDQLGAVVEATESAANQIMDACDTLETVASEIDPAPAQRIRDAITVIYEACGFQDLTGQRIVTVTNTLGFIEGKLGEVMTMLGISPDDLAAEERAAQAGNSDEALLNGPQLPQNAIDQSEIDKLLADLG
jgi:chemotaxis protein CheZ